MTVTNVTKDPEVLTFEVTSEFTAPIEAVWQIWADPRKLEQWWGPPEYPATVTNHEFRVGGAVAYHMTGPTGDEYHGWWRIRAVDEPHFLEFEDGFAELDGQPADGLPPTVSEVRLSHEDGVTTMVIRARFESLEAMEQLIEMGAEEGMIAALGQVPNILASART